jgi:hypothetical protein
VDGCDVWEGKRFRVSVSVTRAAGVSRDHVLHTLLILSGCGCGGQRYCRSHVCWCTCLTAEGLFFKYLYAQEKQRSEECFKEMAFGPAEPTVDLDLPRCKESLRMLARPIRSLTPSVSFPPSPILSPHEALGDSAKTLHWPQKGHRHRTRRRNNLLRRILRHSRSRRDPKDIRSYEVRAACSFPATLPFHSKTDALRPSHLRLLPLSG